MKFNQDVALKTLPIFFGGVECVGHSFAYVVHFVFLRDVWIDLNPEICRIKQARLVTHLQRHAFYARKLSFS
jgi:hypothetical protein